jgi:hypothetical protein
MDEGDVFAIETFWCPAGFCEIVAQDHR